MCDTGRHTERETFGQQTDRQAQIVYRQTERQTRQTDNNQHIYETDTQTDNKTDKHIDTERIRHKIHIKKTGK